MELEKEGRIGHGNFVFEIRSYSVTSCSPGSRQRCSSRSSFTISTLTFNLVQMIPSQRSLAARRLQGTLGRVAAPGILLPRTSMTPAHTNRRGVTTASRRPRQNNYPALRSFASQSHNGICASTIR